MKRAWALGAAILLAGCGTEDRNASAEERAIAAADELTKTLGGRLKAALAEAGPAAAIEVCAEAAPALGREIGESRGVSVRRTALRVRNPANAPDDWERAQLDLLATDASRTSSVERFPDELRYARPIRLQALCVKCHGDPASLAPEVREALARHYPADKATGYAPGDLRGIVSIRVPLE